MFFRFCILGEQTSGKGAIFLKLNDKQTQKLLEYTGQMQIKQLSLSMALTRLRGIYKTNPTPGTVSKCTTELNALLDKFAIIMKSDYEWITGL